MPDRRDDMARTCEERMAQIERLTRMGHWELDIARNHLYWSEEIFRIFEMDPRSFQASYEGFLKTVHPDDREKVHQAYSESLAKRAPYSMTHRLLMSDGRIKHVEENCETDFGSDGKPLVSRGTVQDVTRAVETEEKNRELQERIFIAAKLASVGELAAGVGHEINNPLFLISMAREQLETLLRERGLQSGEFDRLLQQQKDALGRILVIVNSLRLYARADENKTEVFDLNQEVDHSLSLLSAIFEKQGISIEIQRGTTAIPVLGLMGRIQQVMINILNNSRDALEGRPNQRIVIRIRQKGEVAELELEDYGCGIDPKILPRVGQTFFTTKEPGKGTGLGVSISANIVRQMGGELKISSRLGERTTVLITLPIVSDPIEKVTLPKRPDCAAAPSQLKARVLLIDDEPMIREMLEELLTDYGMEVTTHGDAHSAFPLLSKGFDLVICDMTLPRLQGTEFLKRLRSEGLFQGKMVLMTGNLNLGDNEKVADHVLYKPFQTNEILMLIRKLLSNS